MLNGVQNEFPLLSRIYKAYKEVPAIQNAMPEKQPDAPAEARVWGTYYTVNKLHIT